MEHIAQLSISGLAKRFRGVYALNGVDICLSSDQSTGIIGPNGSGKTTLFNVVTGFLRPDAGKVMWDGRDITGYAPHRIARLGIVRTFQQTMVFPSLSVEQNLRVALLGAGVRGRAADERLEESLESLALAGYRAHPADQIPFGIGRRLGIAAALASKPTLLLLDEPAAGLDDDESRELAGILRRIRESGCGIALVDHNMDFVLPFCDRVIVMNAGSVLTQGGPEVVAERSVMEVYLG
jgi:ABC-type branched-subunit amino acid transport system ATPase component